MSFNFRLCTKTHISVSGVYRTFGIYEVYYEDEVPVSYTEGDLMKYWEKILYLKETYNKIGLAFNKPILDLDNFPNIYKG